MTCQKNGPYLMALPAVFVLRTVWICFVRGTWTKPCSWFGGIAVKRWFVPAIFGWHNLGKQKKRSKKPAGWMCCRKSWTHSQGAKWCRDWLICSSNEHSQHATRMRGCNNLSLARTILLSSFAVDRFQRWSHCSDCAWINLVELTPLTPQITYRGKKFPPALGD